MTKEEIREKHESWSNHGGGSSTAKVPGDVPPLKGIIQVWPRVYFLAISVWERVCLLAVFWSKKNNFCNTFVETRNFGDLGLENGKFWQFIPRKRQLMAASM